MASELPKACELLEHICQRRAAFLPSVWRESAETPHGDTAVIMQQLLMQLINPSPIWLWTNAVKHFGNSAASSQRTTMAALHDAPKYGEGGLLSSAT